MSERTVRPTAAHRQAIDWDDIHRRLERLRLTIEREWVAGPAEIARILHQRAQALAMPLSAEPEPELEVIEFLLGEEHYGIASSAVREVLALTDLARVPCTPPFVLGIINVRGEIVSVIDLKKFFALPGQDITDLNRVLLLEGRGMLFGILADRLLGVRPQELSEVINTAYGGSFYDLVNRARVDMAKVLLREPRARRRKMLDIALSVGFSSQSTFYSQFRKQTGMTPTVWRDKGEGWPEGGETADA